MLHVAGPVQEDTSTPRGTDLHQLRDNVLNVIQNILFLTIFSHSFLSLSCICFHLSLSLLLLSLFLMDRHNLHAPANFAAFPKPRFDFGGCQSQVMSTVLSDTRLTQTQRRKLGDLLNHTQTQASINKKRHENGRLKVNRNITIRHKHKIFLPIIDTISTDE